MLTFDVPTKRVVKGRSDTTVPLVDLSFSDVIEEKKENKKEEKSHTPFPFDLLSPDFKKLMGFPEI